MALKQILQRLHKTFPFPLYRMSCILWHLQKRELIILSRNLPDLWISFSKKRGDTPIKLIVINYAVLCLNYLMSTSTLYFVPDLKEQMHCIDWKVKAWQMQIKLFTITSKDIIFQKHWLWKIEDAEYMSWQNFRRQCTNYFNKLNYLPSSIDEIPGRTFEIISACSISENELYFLTAWKGISRDRQLCKKKYKMNVCID